MTEYALPLVLHLEKADPPGRSDALAAAARAVLLILTADEPSWAEALSAWQDARIRKVVRRARGAGWRRAVALPGITVEHGTASVRVFPPVPNDDWPAELGRLQVAGTDLTDPAPPGPPRPGLPVVWLNGAVQMTAGKAMAQAGHAAQLGWWQLPAAARSVWLGRDLELSVRTAAPPHWAGLVAAGCPVVHDGGFTEVEPGTATALIDLRPL